MGKLSQFVHIYNNLSAIKRHFFEINFFQDKKIVLHYYSLNNTMAGNIIALGTIALFLTTDPLTSQPMAGSPKSAS